MIFYNEASNNYIAVKNQLQSAGFKDISIVNLENVESDNKASLVESVSIDGEKTFSADDYFSPDATVVISYY